MLSPAWFLTLVILNCREVVAGISVTDEPSALASVISKEEEIIEQTSEEASGAVPAHVTELSKLKSDGSVTR